MKDPSGYIRTWLYTVLNGNVNYNNAAVPVYSFPPKDQATPCIIIGEQSTGSERGTKDCYITNHSTTLEIYQSYPLRASYIPPNAIMNDVLQIVRTRTQPTGMTGFRVISHVTDGMETDRYVTEGRMVVQKNVRLNFLIEETINPPDAGSFTADSTLITADSDLYTADAL